MVPEYKGLSNPSLEQLKRISALGDTPKETEDCWLHDHLDLGDRRLTADHCALCLLAASAGQLVLGCSETLHQRSLDTETRHLSSVSKTRRRHSLEHH